MMASSPLPLLVRALDAESFPKADEGLREEEEESQGDSGEEGEDDEVMTFLKAQREIRQEVVQSRGEKLERYEREKAAFDRRLSKLPPTLEEYEARRRRIAVAQRKEMALADVLFLKEMQQRTGNQSADHALNFYLGEKGAPCQDNPLLRDTLGLSSPSQLDTSTYGDDFEPSEAVENAEIAHGGGDADQYSDDEDFVYSGDDQDDHETMRRSGRLLTEEEKKEVDFRKRFRQRRRLLELMTAALAEEYGIEQQLEEIDPEKDNVEEERAALESKLETVKKGNAKCIGELMTKYKARRVSTVQLKQALREANIRVPDIQEAVDEAMLAQFESMQLEAREDAEEEAANAYYEEDASPNREDLDESPKRRTVGQKTPTRRFTAAELTANGAEEISAILDDETQAKPMLALPDEKPREVVSELVEAHTQKLDPEFPTLEYYKRRSMEDSRYYVPGYEASRKSQAPGITEGGGYWIRMRRKIQARQRKRRAGKRSRMSKARRGRASKTSASVEAVQEVQRHQETAEAREAERGAEKPDEERNVSADFGSTESDTYGSDGFED